MRENYGFPARELTRIQRVLLANLKALCSAWESMGLDNKVASANRKAQELSASLPKATTAHYDRRLGQVVIRLSSKLDVAFSPKDAEGLENAKPSQLEPIEISPSGFGIHFPKLDADIYIPALLEGFFGSKSWMAKRLGAAGGRRKSAAKVSASKKNGKLGGRPRRAATASAA